MAKVALEMYGPLGLNGRLRLRPLSISHGNRAAKIFYRKPKCLRTMSYASPEEQLQFTAPPIMVNACTGKMGRAVLEAAISAGLDPVPASFSGSEESGKTVQIGGKEIKVYGPSERKSILSSIYDEYPNMIVVDYTVPNTVNGNAELYCEVGVPFVMGTTGGNREKLFKTVADFNTYAVISPQMGKQVVAFLAILQSMAEQFPGAFAGYNLEVMESHQASKLDISGTAKAVISCFEKLGATFEFDQIKQIRDPIMQKHMVGVPEEYLSGHAFHMYHLTSPDETVSFEFQHNVCGRSIYAEGTVDAVLFLAKMVQIKAEKRIYNMIDVLREVSVQNRRQESMIKSLPYIGTKSGVIF